MYLESVVRVQERAHDHAHPQSEERAREEAAVEPEECDHDLAVVELELAVEIVAVDVESGLAAAGIVVVGQEPKKYSKRIQFPG